MKPKIIRTFLTAILVHILLAIMLYYTLGWADELPDELTARPALVLLGTFASAMIWFNNLRVLFCVIDVSDRKSIEKILFTQLSLWILLAILFGAISYALMYQRCAISPWDELECFLIFQCDGWICCLVGKRCIPTATDAI